MEHTGFGLNNETCECSAGVQHFTKRNKKWTHWAIPRGLYGGEESVPVSDNPTLRRGSKGDAVVRLQTSLVNLGYDIGSCGVDGDYGRATEAAVKAFQRDHGLAADGICGPLTYAALEDNPSQQLYTVHVPMLPLYKAEALVAAYSGAYMTKEGSKS